MRDIELYQQILGLEEPWSVKEVELHIDEGRVDIHVEHHMATVAGKTFNRQGANRRNGRIPRGKSSFRSRSPRHYRQNGEAMFSISRA